MSTTDFPAKMGSHDIVIDESEFYAGVELGWAEFRSIGQTPDVVGVSDDFQCGYWNGVGGAAAWHAGWAAAEAGVMACPYLFGSDDECFREIWLNGYADAMLSDSFCAWGRA